MKLETLKKRLAKDRPMVTVTLRIPADVVKDIKCIARLRDISSYQALMRAYIGAGLREDMERIEVEQFQDDLLDSVRQMKAGKAARDARPAAAPDHYTYRVTWSPEDGGHVGLCAEFPSLSWLADTPEESLAGIRQVVSEAVADIEANGDTVPFPLVEDTHKKG